MFMRKSTCAAGVGALALILGLAGGAAAQSGTDGRYGFGDPAPKELVEKWAIAIPPDGQHLPSGGATAAEGEHVYMNQCASCHGKDLQGDKDTGGSALIGGRGTLDSGSPKKTVESYWPYATTLFDYLRRAMPFYSPGSMTNAEVYGVTAYILYKADIIGKNKEMNAKTLPKVDMPNKNGFIRDPRPDVHNYE